MENALIVSCIEKSAALFTEMLNAASINQIVAVKSAGEARRLVLDRDFDLVVINAPLNDETGEDLSRYIASRNVSQVLLVVKCEYFDAVSAACEDSGVLTISKPLNKTVFWSALKLANSAQNRLRRIHNENSKLKQQIEDIRIIDRAKCLLISYLGMNEQEAHRYIEKQAMDMRSRKRTVAEDILKMYDN